MVCRTRSGSEPGEQSAVLPTSASRGMRRGRPPLNRVLNCFSSADVVYDAAMTSSLIATPNRLSPPLAQGYGMTPGRRMAGTSTRLAAPVDRVRLRVEAE